MAQGVAQLQAQAPLPPFNLEAEESVLGALLLGSSLPDHGAGVLDAVQAAGLEPAMFYREAHARIYRACATLISRDEPADAILVVDELERSSQLDQVGGKARVLELAALVPATSNAGHWARLIVEEATARDVIRVGAEIQRLGYERAAPADELVSRSSELVAELDRTGTRARPLDGYLRHDQVLDLDLPADRYLIDDLIPCGAVGTIAAVPEAHKSWLAQAIAVRIARGGGWVLGKQVSQRARVGYIWQDDSTREEAERVKAFEQAHPTDPDGSTDLLWWLNTGVQLPRDIHRLAAAVTQHELQLLILDSYYNFLPGVDLKDDQAEQIVAQLKADIADRTGCTVLIVDHMPWATDTNRQRLRAYGGVFKNAATRFGIYIDAAGDKLHVEARGNNIRGIPRRLAYWDADSLELKLVNDDDVSHEDLLEFRVQDVIEWLEQHPGRHTGTAVRDAVHGKAALTDQALEQLKTQGRIRDEGRDGGPWSGKRGATRYWTATLNLVPNARDEVQTRDELQRQTTIQAEQPRPEPRDDVGRGSQTLNPVPAARDEVGRGGTRSPEPLGENLVPTADSPPKGEADGDEVEAATTQPRPDPPDEVTDNTQTNDTDDSGWFDE